MSSNPGRRTPLPTAELIQPEWHAERREQVLARVHARLGRRARGLRAALVVSVAAVLGLVIGFVVHARVEPQAVAARDAHQVRFGDGSPVQLLDAGSVLDVGAASPSAVEVTLRSGSAEFEITPNPKRQFIVHAGVADISVLGTHFRVTREGPRVRVEVTRGRVAVNFAGGARQLTAGESSWFPPPSRARRVAGTASSAPSATPCRQRGRQRSPPSPSASADTLALASLFGARGARRIPRGLLRPGARSGGRRQRTRGSDAGGRTRRASPIIPRKQHVFSSA